LFDHDDPDTDAAADDDRRSSSLGASSSGQQPDVYPTFVPRNPGVKDGVWNQTDETVVRQALSDALKRREAQEEGGRWQRTRMRLSVQARAAAAAPSAPRGC
jgi:hypothetical protein